MDTRETCPLCFGSGNGPKVLSSGLDVDGVPFAIRETCPTCDGRGTIKTACCICGTREWRAMNICDGDRPVCSSCMGNPTVRAWVRLHLHHKAKGKRGAASPARGDPPPSRAEEGRAGEEDKRSEVPPSRSEEANP